MRELARLELPDLPGEERYVAAWLVTPVRYPSDLLEWGPILEDWSGRWVSIANRMNRRKGSEGLVYYRAMSVYYGAHQAVLYWKVMIREHHEGQADSVIEVLAQEMRAVDTDRRRYSDGGHARLQLMCDSTSHLVGFSPELRDFERLDLLQAHVETLKGKHVFQALSDLSRLAKEIPKVEPLICTVCGERVNRQILDLGTRLGSAQISPTSPDYIWREHRTQHRPPPPPRSRGSWGWLLTTD